MGTVELEELSNSRERTRALVLWLSCEGHTDVWDLFSEKYHLSAILYLETLTKSPEIAVVTSAQFSWFEGYWGGGVRGGYLKSLSIKDTEIGVTSPTVATKDTQQNDVIWQPYHVCLAVAEHQILERKHFLLWVPESGKIWWLKKVQYLKKKYHCKWTLLRGRKPKWISHNLSSYEALVSIWFQRNGKSDQPLEIVYRGQE